MRGLPSNSTSVAPANCLCVYRCLLSAVHCGAPAWFWCGRGDLNPHAFRRHPLKMVCLPVSPLPLWPVMQPICALKRRWERNSHYSKTGKCLLHQSLNQILEILIVFPCFQLPRGEYWPQRYLRHQGILVRKICAQQSFLFRQKGCWPLSATPFWRMRDMVSSPFPRLILHFRCFG